MFPWAGAISLIIPCGLVVDYANSVVVPPIMGPYVLDVKEFKACEEEESGLYMYKVRLTNVGGQVVGNGDIELKEDLDDDVSVYINLKAWINDGWKDIYNIKNTKACTDGVKLVPESIDLFRKTGYNFTSCPVPKGIYSFTGLDFTKLTLARFPELLYNKYKVIGEAVKNKTRVGCNVCIVHIAPKDL